MLLLKEILSKIVVLNVIYVIHLTKKFKPYSCASGDIVLNYTTSFQMSDKYRQILADEATPDAVLLAENSAVVRMYSNGTTEVVVGNRSTSGCV